MNIKSTSISWSTASIGDGNHNVTTAEMLGLGDHLDLCKGLHGRMFTLQCLVESLHSFMVTHVVTSAVLITLLIGFGSLVI